MSESGSNRIWQPLVSVIVPLYNVEDYLAKCVESILGQSYPNLELILVDDASTDRSGEICEQYKAEDARVKVIHKPNGGPAAARNAGMRIACGELFAFVDSDDYLAPDTIARLIQAMDQTDADLSICGMKRTCSRCEEPDRTTFEMTEYDAAEALIHMLYVNPFGTAPWGKLYKRELFDGVEFPEGKFSEDLFTIYRAILNSTRVVFCSFTGYFYYYRAGSLVASRYSEKYLQPLEAVDQIAQAAGDRGPALEKAIAYQYLNLIYDIVARKPSKEDYLHPLIQNTIRRSRRSVLTDAQAPLRLRGFALLTYFGYSVTAAVIALHDRIHLKRIEK